MKIKWIRAKCFLSIGTKGIFLDFTKLSDIVRIAGLNLDVSPQSSNGAGKSTIYEIIVYAFFGQVAKDLNHPQVINDKIGKRLEAEVGFELNGSDYVVLRKRSPDSLTLTVNGVDQTEGGSPAVQKRIESIIKLNYSSFINVVCFGEHNNHAFLSCKPETRRSIVENLLGLEKYLKYSKIAKDLVKEANANLKVLTESYDNNVSQKDGCTQRITQYLTKQTAWKKTKQDELAAIKVAITKKEEELSKTDDGNAIVLYEQAQQRIKTNKDDIVKCEESRSQLFTLNEQMKVKQDELQNLKNDASVKVKGFEVQISGKKSELQTLDNQNKIMAKLKPGVKCNVCFGTVDPSNYQHLINHNNDLMALVKTTLLELNKSYESAVADLTAISGKVSTLIETRKKGDDKYKVIANRINTLLTAVQKDQQIKEPQAGSREILLKEQLAELNRKLASKTDEINNQDPYNEIITQTEKERSDFEFKIKESKGSIEEANTQIRYYEFWVEGFGDNGIRSYIIDGILPALNARINYWLQFLIYNKLKLTFDNQFKPTIERNPPDGKPFAYNNTSAGERRRINLAISQAFAHITAISAGIDLDTIYLDEVALNVDLQGIHGIYAMICELAKDKRVFVTTHDPNLVDLLSSCDLVTIVKKDGFSELLEVDNVPKFDE